MELHWWSIEVVDGPAGTARGWRDAVGAALTEAAITNGAYDWAWHRCTWGIVFEIAFASDEGWRNYRQLPAVAASLDAVPNPVTGLHVYPGRGGSTGQSQPRRPRPIAGAGAAALPEPEAPSLHAIGKGHPPSGVAFAH